MAVTVYLDQVFLLNAIVDYLLLLMTAQLAGCGLKRKRFAAFSGLGGLYAVSTFLMPAAATPWVMLLVGGLLTAGAFGREFRGRYVALYFGLSAALAGLLLAFDSAIGARGQLMQHWEIAQISLPMMLGAAVSCYFVITIFFRQSIGEGKWTMDITIHFKGKECRVRALHDTGNMLRDPIGGQNVLLVERNALAAFWTATVFDVLQRNIPAEEKMAALARQDCVEGFTLLPFRSIGTSAGLLLAFYCDYIKIGRRIMPHIPVAIVDESVGVGYHALWGGERKENYAQGESSDDPFKVSRKGDRAG